MQFSATSIYFLWAAYTLVAVAMFGRAVWLYSTWRTLDARKRQDDARD